MTEFEIVQMTAKHAASVAELEKQCFPDPWSFSSVLSETENPLSLWLCAVSGGRVVGYIGSQTAAGESDVMNLAVAPECRRHGVGGALLAELENRLRQLGSTALTLEVRISNAAAIALYEKNGFACVGVRPNYYFHPREDARILRKEWIADENSCN